MITHDEFVVYIYGMKYCPIDDVISIHGDVIIIQYDCMEITAEDMIKGIMDESK